MVEREYVIWAYRLLLGREPESEEVISRHMQSSRNAAALVTLFTSSPEYQSGFGSSRHVPSLSGYEPPSPIETDVDVSREQLSELFWHVQKTWTHLGNFDPFWAVLSADDEFHHASREDTIKRFYASGDGDIARLTAMLKRNGLDFDNVHTAVDFGCGLGRATMHLAKHVQYVTGMDISEPMLNGAKGHFASNSIANAEFRHIQTIDDINSIPAADLFFSLIVLQHSPPPLICVVLKNAFQALRPRGIAFFQVPTYLRGYSYDCRAHIEALAASSHRQFEIHAVPQARIFRLAQEAHCDVLEVIEDNAAGAGWGSLSNTFLIQKRA